MIDVFNMIAEATMPDQLRKTERVINRMIPTVQMIECSNCEHFFEPQHITQKMYKNPYNGQHLHGNFCPACSEKQNNIHLV